MALTRQITASLVDVENNPVENATIAFKLNRPAMDTPTGVLISDDSVERLTDSLGQFVDDLYLFCNDRAYGENSYYIVTISYPGEGPRDYIGFVPEGDGSALELGLVIDPDLNITAQEAAIYASLVAARDAANSAANLATLAANSAGVVPLYTDLPTGQTQSTIYQVAKDFFSGSLGGMSIWQKTAATGVETGNDYNGWTRISIPLSVGDMLRSTYDSDLDGKVSAETHTHKTTTYHNYVIPGEIKVAVGDTDFIPPFALEAGVLKKIAVKIESGTSATVKLQYANAGTGWVFTDVPGSSQTVTTTLTSHDLADLTLTGLTLVKAVVTAVSGTPKHLTYSILIDYDSGNNSV